LANNYFQFKQFTVYQQNCAMKVCTDACILGAYTSQKLTALTKHVLDIGTGTGLLSLMLAQKSTAHIDALEINSAASKQATENAEQSPWAGRINVFNIALQQFNPLKKYDLIISNPPFFEYDLRSTSAEKNDAKHGSSLTLQELADSIKMHLGEDGLATVLLPWARTHYFTQVAEMAGLFVNELLLIKQSPKHAFFRSVFLLGNKKNDYRQIELIIHNDEREYSPEFAALMKDYYLK
jgi:tRNA1Val (adenine37-N6)-methyltransferase